HGRVFAIATPPSFGFKGCVGPNLVTLMHALLDKKSGPCGNFATRTVWCFPPRADTSRGRACTRKSEAPRAANQSPLDSRYKNGGVVSEPAPPTHLTGEALPRE